MWRFLGELSYEIPSCEETPNILCSVSAHHDIYSNCRSDSVSAPDFSFRHENRSNQSSFVLHNMTKLSQLFMWKREKQQLHFFIRLFMFNLLMLNCFIISSCLCLFVSAFLKRSENLQSAAGSVNTDTVQSVSQVQSPHCCTGWD